MSKRDLLKAFINNDKQYIKTYIDNEYTTFIDGEMEFCNGTHERWRADGVFFSITFCTSDREKMIKKYRGSLKDFIHDYLGKVDFDMVDIIDPTNNDLVFSLNLIS
jgi:hypothetical protein